MIAALYVDPGGCYAGLPGVELWDEKRDARSYAGPHPVVAHPPCTRWCRLAGLVEARYGYKRGDDGGTFAAALAAIRAWGGVLEHPAFSGAWVAHDLTPPLTGAGWQAADFHGGWSCYVEQWFYGHKAKKATWLYARGVELPSLRWGHTPDQETTAYVSDAGISRERRALVSWCGNRIKSGEQRERLGSREASATPLEFRDLLLSIAATARR